MGSGIDGCPFTEEVSNWLAVGALASPHLLYAFIWYFPRVWMSLYGRWSVQVFESLAWILKVFQFTSIAAWVYIRAYSIIGASPVLELVQSLHPLQILLGVGLIAFGQVLNVGIFKAIGHTGVYYGFKLGHTIPWVDGFPFNVVQHPQYVGSVATVWGAAVLLWSFVPVADMMLLTFYWTAMYVLTGIMESCT